MSTIKLCDLIERAITDSGRIFWPSLAILERLDAELETLPKKKRAASRSQLGNARQAILFDARRLAEDLAAAVERQAAVEQIASGGRPVHSTPADEDARVGGRRG